MTEILEATTVDLSIVIPLFTSLPMLSTNVKFSNFAFVLDKYIKLSSPELLVNIELERVKASGSWSLFDP